MGLITRVVKSWYLLSFTTLLSILVLLRRDYTNILDSSEKLETEAINNNNLFYDFVARSNVEKILSQNGNHIVFANVRRPRNSDLADYDVSIATHCTYYNLRYLPNLAKAWNGPISISVFTTRPTKTLIFIDLIRKCSLPVAKFARFHVVVPFSRDMFFAKPHPGAREPDILRILTSSHQDRMQTNMICHNLNSLMLNLENIEENYDLGNSLPYPNNLLRNVAWENSRTSYIINLDIDLIPSKNLHDHLINFLRNLHDNATSWDQSIAHVLPTFEIRSREYEFDKVKFPIDKTTLQTYIDSKTIRPFYQVACPRCQNCTQFERWYELATNTNSIHAAYYMEWEKPCEPFILLPKMGVPKYDERFVQYGYNRISHICELHVAGWQFTVLNNAFLIHVGFKTGNKESFHSSKDEDMKSNYIKLINFQRELSLKYPESTRYC